ncbi:MAG: N-acetylmuramoyl-L-alanine amidase [Tychonema bourrellyi B0820]|uniref:N-acetylmuramoyl-L-alanine amidase n=1 Tax=Tychonema bourrellyi FEM_GT703 TaxID=2040638 RepID=A0A2G4EUQ1_9CYAN|nr:N-acetylmuramoyl-L-alanine amidase [Tychonema bourrellyi]MDQ2097859.1 N-acetylmuramoyl-L-alanine amidase [Tychonema bourrellyi B0820]PHX53160.1 N-acetylmuramoyl-L-alanine amidase [Tychonema bourrellyi FEM_GT703]
MKFHWLLSSFLGVFLLTGAAEAARLQSWRFDASQNRLYITTDGGVQPKAQLIFNPTRLVIDLPGTSLGRQSVNQPYSGAIESVRLGQFDDDTTRIVVELKDGYTIDPSQVKFRGLSPSEWTVDLPTPVRAGNPNSSSELGGERLSVESSAPSSQTAAATVIQNIQVTADGFLIRTAGGRPQINFQQSRAGDIATLDIEDATLSPGLSNQQPQTNGKHGVERIEVRQLPTEPPMTRVTLRMKSSNTQWRASLSSLGGISLLPAGVRQSATPRPLTVDPPIRSSVSVPPPLAQNRNPISWPRTNTGTTDLPQVSNSRRVVVIDPGHGGRDPGAVGIGGIQEKEIVLDISFQVARILEQQGVQAVLSRTDDSEIDLEPRVSLAERLNATLFVSIHANAINMSRPDVSGIETYYYGSGLDLARVIHNSILEGTGAADRRVRQARFYVLRKTTMPSVLLEVGFVTGAEDAARLSDPAYRSQMAASIARGILLYLQQR